MEFSFNQLINNKMKSLFTGIPSKLKCNYFDERKN